MVFKRTCKVCGTVVIKEDREGYMYSVEFTKEVKELNRFPEYRELKEGYYNASHLCFGCINELFNESPETIKSIKRVIP